VGKAIVRPIRGLTGVQQYQNGELSALIAAHELISFDVFDTLILRKVSKPTDVFSLVKMKLIAAPEALLHQHTVDGFPELRVRAERLARADKHQREHSQEVTLDEIYCQVARLSRAGPAAVDLLRRTELEVEHGLVYPNPAGKVIFDTALAQHKRIVYCSDMYLPAATIESLLAHCGFGVQDGLYVSCEHARSKGEGTIFHFIAERHGTSTKQILHFGDNRHADLVMAQQAGCSAVHLPYERPAVKVSIPVAGEHPFFPETVGSIVQGILRKRAPNPGNSDDPWERIGYRVFGPLFTGFLLWLVSIAQERRPEKILLFARDCHFVWKNLGRFLNPGIETHYLYVSRASLLLPSLTDFSLPRLWHLFSGRDRHSVGTYLQRLGLDPDSLGGTVRSAGFESLDEIVSNREPRMHDLLAKLHHVLLRESARRRPLAQRYLEGFVGDAQRIMLVDIGWVGNMQASFMRLLGPGHPNRSVRGCYMGLHVTSHENDMLGHTMDGWLTHYGSPSEFENNVWLAGGVELLEFATCAPHGTTLGYQESPTGEVVPILEANTADHAVRELAARVQSGADAFLQEFLASYKDIPAVALASRSWANEFYRLVTDPTLEEAELLGDLTHSDSLGDTTLRLPLAPKIGRGHPIKSIQASEQSYWKAGFSVRNGFRHR
jgi:predicted HAD superfamily hydrolase